MKIYIKKNIFNSKLKNYSVYQHLDKEVHLNINHMNLMNVVFVSHFIDLYYFNYFDYNINLNYYNNLEYVINFV